MQTWLGCDRVPRDLPPTSVTIGTFDGVHRGHRALLEKVVADSADGLLPVAVTFDPHPMAVLRPDLAPLRLTTMQHRLELLESAGLGAVLVVRFTPELAAESAERFATRVLAQTLAARRVVVGGNFRFGHRAAGDVALLAALGRVLGFDVHVVDLELLDRSGDDLPPVSSTAIRSMVAEGDVVGAALALGRPHRVSGHIVPGDRRGRELGYPTANVRVPADLAVPGDGVYATWFRTSEDLRWLPAAVSVGTNPTFSGEDRRVEVFVIDAPAGYDVYDQDADIDFAARIRPMMRFDSPAELVAQMALDVQEARRITAAS
ncbi:MAG: bifunctional riboflavin kinase/FAD synthetase [Candidatus Nanopelagicales bacterium]